ncbi:MAG: hypothetical protein JEZ02_00275 [Desulfatibacillum sp.]|nr:hypothetical protein [Desulfatibacillum sp.]
MDKKNATLPRLAALGLSILSVVMILIALTDTFAEPDLWGYLNFGHLFFNEPGFPFQDAFAYTPTHSTWVFHEWLTGVVLFRLQQAVGFGGIQVLKYLLGGLTAFFLYATAKKCGAGNGWPLAPVFLAGAFFSWAFPAFRALSFTYCFYALFLAVLETARLRENFSRLWALPPTMLLWVNLHGGFLAGLGLVFLYALGRAVEGRRFSPYLKILGVCGLITLINPYGTGLWQTILGHLSAPQHGIREWLSVPGAIYHFGPSYDLLIFLACLGLGGTLLAATRPRDHVAVLVLGATALLGLIHHRHMPFFILGFAVFAPAMLRQILEELTPGKFKPHITIPVVLFAGAMLFFNAQYFMDKTPLAFAGGNPLALKTPAAPYAPGTDSLFYPVGAVGYLETASFSGNILPYATWGGYISWRLYPRCKVAMDLRFETVYPKDIRDEYFEFLRCGPGWTDFLNKYPHDMVLVYAGDNLHKAMARQSGWEEIYQDPFTVIFARRRTETPRA